MAEGAKDNTPGMSTWARLSDRPVMLFRICLGVTDVSIRMVGHRRICPSCCWGLWYSHYTMLICSSAARASLRIAVPEKEWSIL